MSIISADFGSALAQLRNAVSSLSTTVASLQQEVEALKREVKQQEDSTADLDAAVIRAALMGNQDQLHTLSQQPLTTRQAELVRLSTTEEIVPHQFQLDPAMLQRLRELKPSTSLLSQSHQPTESQLRNQRMQQAVSKLNVSQNLPNSVVTQIEKARQEHQMNLSAQQRTARNRMQPLVKRNDELDQY